VCGRRIGLGGRESLTLKPCAAEGPRRGIGGNDACASTSTGADEGTLADVCERASGTGQRLKPWVRQQRKGPLRWLECNGSE
jgi:hypothetical protein